VEHKEFSRVFIIASHLQPLRSSEYGKPDRQRIIKPENGLGCYQNDNPGMKRGMTDRA
jgi:hypothetical protein